MEMYDCDNFRECTASVCPMWKPINQQRVIKGDELCLYLLEYQKKWCVDEIFKGAYLKEVAKLMAKATKEIFTRPETPNFLKKGLERASTTGSRILTGRKLCQA